VNPGGQIVRFKDITDGLSKTLMASETILGVNQSATVGDLRGFTWWGPGAVFHGFYQPNTTSEDSFQFTTDCNPTGDSRLPCRGGVADVQLFARSRHVGGVLTGMCDGSIRFIEESIPQPVWRALSTAKFGEVENY
jgi:hypothetical protein